MTSQTLYISCVDFNILRSAAVDRMGYSFMPSSPKQGSNMTLEGLNVLVVSDHWPLLPIPCS